MLARQASFRRRAASRGAADPRWRIYVAIGLGFAPGPTPAASSETLIGAHWKTWSKSLSGDRTGRVCLGCPLPLPRHRPTNRSQIFSTTDTIHAETTLTTCKFGGSSIAHENRNGSRSGDIAHGQDGLIVRQ
jgi:hypothetical protein